MRWRSVRRVPDGKVKTIPYEGILPSRFAYRFKMIYEHPWSKAKSRLVVQGFRDPHLCMF